MKIPASPHFTPLNLSQAFNIDWQTLSGTLLPPADKRLISGEGVFRGIPFLMGNEGKANVILLDHNEVRIDVGGQSASYILFLHVVEDRITNYLDNFADTVADGNELGQLVANYQLQYADGTSESTPILRRFAIQQAHIRWGASAFAALPMQGDQVFPTVTEQFVLDGTIKMEYGEGETRNTAGRGIVDDHLWLYALPNPHPDKPIQQIVCTAQQERALIYGITLTQVQEHPLRSGLRQKLLLTLPEGCKLNKLGELDQVAIDLGTVISARATLDYDHERWLGNEPNVQPSKSEKAVLVEYTAHPQARLYVGTGDESYVEYELTPPQPSPDKGGSRDGADSMSGQSNNLIHPMTVPSPSRGGLGWGLLVAPAHRPVKIHVVEKTTHQPTAVRIHFHGAAGEYLPPRGNHRKVNPFWFEDNYGEFVNGLNQYAYIPGECVIDLPLGEVYVEITKGYEVAPIRTRFEVTAETEEITFELEKALHWREQGWVTADTHVHFLSPTTALLEGQAEGVNVVNLLASQWGEMFSNVTDFDGRTTLGAKDFGGNGEFLVRVGTENRMQTLGHISLLGYRGSMIHPLCTGGPSESAIGDPQEVTMAEWAQRCIDQGGLVVMPHAPNPQLERAADIVLGLIHGIELMSFNPHDSQLSPYGIADWYRYLSLGYQVPLVGGSDKMGQAWQLGGMRTYAHLRDREFNYENWMAAIQAGNTFATVGPLLEMWVDGMAPGGKIQLPASGGTLNVTWKVESVRLPIDQVEVVVGGLVAAQVNVGKALSASGSVNVPVHESTWIALRVRGSYRGQHGEIAAHSSAVQVLVEGKALFNLKHAGAVLEQIEGAIAYVDTLAPRPDALRFKQMRATLEAAHNRLHQRMHQQGMFHQHTPLHDHNRVREH
ncbi:MAG: CehA/McbA family metallohydrolase [Caldilineaceae bacterium]